MNSKLKLIIYRTGTNNCSCIEKLLQNDFDINLTTSKDSLVNNLLFSSCSQKTVDGAIFCLNTDSPDELSKKIKELIEVKPFSGHRPVLPCIGRIDHEFFHQATNKGLSKILTPVMKTEKIVSLVNSTIRQNDLIIFILQKFPRCFDKSPYAKRIVEQILFSFPQRITIKDTAKELGISAEWINHKCKEAFNITFTQLKRTLRVFYAAKLIQQTSMDNKEIAFRLHYSEESNMARDFRTTLNLSPSQIREKLTHCSVNHLFNLD